MGLLDFFRRKGGTDPVEPERIDTSQAEPGLPAEGPPAGVSDPGSVTGEDVAPQAGDETVGGEKPSSA